MRWQFLAVLAAGVLAGSLVTGLSALAANPQVVAEGSSWVPDQVPIAPGESVTWSNPASGNHNVCVSRQSSAASSCDVYSSGAPTTAWPPEGHTVTFNEAGTFRFICQFHGGMTGTVTVGGGGTTTTGTGTLTQPTTGTTPAQTQPGTGTTPTQDTTPTAADSTPPSFTSPPRRRASRTSLILEIRASEAATLHAIVSRRARGRRVFARVGRASVKVKQGRNIVKLPRRAAGSLRGGAYRVKLRLVDAAGNRSAARTLSFKVA